jgi:hypothetical protein
MFKSFFGMAPATVSIKSPFSGLPHTSTLSEMNPLQAAAAIKSRCIRVNNDLIKNTRNIGYSNEEYKTGGISETRRAEVKAYIDRLENESRILIADLNESCMHLQEELKFPSMNETKGGRRKSLRRTKKKRVKRFSKGYKKTRTT